MAYILPGSDLFTWCEHGTPLGHSCQFCRTTAVYSPPPPPVPAQPVQYGWKCSGCGHSYAPWVPECHHCPGPEQPAFIAKGTGLRPLHIDGMTCDPPCEDGPCGSGA